MKRYSEYKDSGVEWIGEIPSHWEVLPMRHLLQLIQTGSTPSTSVDEFFDGDIKWFAPGDFSDDKYLINCNRQITRLAIDKNESKLLPKDTVLLVGIGATLGKVAMIKEESAFNQQITGLVTNKKIVPQFLYYWLKMNTNTLLKTSNFTTLPIVNNEFIKSFPTICPSVNEQKIIVAHLDKKTSQIEMLISKKQELIETLKASRTKLISETVTKGLDKDVPMKDSGVEWIGDIPRDWEVKKLRYLGNLQNGISKSAEEFGFGYPFVSYGNVHKNSSIPKEIEGLVNSSKEERRIYSVTEGDVFFTRTSETIEEIGFASTCLDTIQDATFAGFLIRFRQNNNKLYKGYSKYYFRSDIHRKFFVKEMNLVTRASLGQSLLNNLPVVIPSYEGQVEISEYLDKQVDIINNSILKIEEQIELLKKAKQKLITEVVTGKIDIRHKI